MAAKPATLPLRTGIIGLSASAVTSWAASAHLPALTHPKGAGHYRITALCNSSEPAARAAVKAFSLPAATKTYGTPSDLAADPDVDIVICNTRVDKHFETIIPSVRAGKTVYVEWPVTESVAKTEELVGEAEKSGSVVAVGLQGPWAPAVLKVKELLKTGGLGKVLSSEIRAFGGLNDRTGLPVGLKYFGDWKVGGNIMTIGFAHMIDYVQSAVGEYKQGTTRAFTQIQRPENRAFNPETKETVETFRSDVPDLIAVNGNLEPTDSVAEGALLTVRYRRGQAFKGEPTFTWSINCEKGEIRLVNPGSAALQAFDDASEIQVHRFGSDEVESVAWDYSADQKEVQVRARNVMSTLCALAEGDQSGYTSLASAARRAKQIDAWITKGEW